MDNIISCCTSQKEGDDSTILNIPAPSMAPTTLQKSYQQEDEEVRRRKRRGDSCFLQELTQNYCFLSTKISNPKIANRLVHLLVYFCNNLVTK